METVILIGLPASGKSTFCKQRFFETHIRINLDMLRTRHREALLVAACLAAKQPYVVDNTNVTLQERAIYIQQAKAAEFRVIGFYFQSKIADTLARNKLRQGRQHVPDQAILAKSKQLEMPSLEESFDQLNYVWLDEQNQFQVEEWQDGL